MASAKKAPKPLTSGDFLTAEIHEARALIRGDDECRCVLCKRVRAALKQECVSP